MSIFAEQLQYVLKQHRKTFAQLHNIFVEYDGYTVRCISEGQIHRLKQAVKQTASGRPGHTVTLNRYELEAVQEAFSFTSEEINRLRAALAAEFILRFLSLRIEWETAVMVGEALFRLLFDEDDSAFMMLRNRMVNNIRGDDREESIPEQWDSINTPAELEPAIEAYENALLWLDTARIAQNPILRQGYLAMIDCLLTSAQELLDNPPGAVSATSQREEWRQAIALARLEANKVKSMPGSSQA
jgi:hypothetical protein